MNLLKEQTDRGKLILVNIHQPGSDIYKTFDKIMIIDKGGYQIFYGNPSEAIVYFKTNASYANANEDQCVSCGNVNSDQLLQIIEAKVINEKGKQTHIRKVSPQQWAERFQAWTGKNERKAFTGDKSLPENYYSIPGLRKQSQIYFIRDILSKLANRQYVLISLLGAPLLALLLSYFTKYTVDGNYVFSDNENLPSYMFMCVITSLFLGLIISAEEIVKDRKILKRESFLNLSWLSYLNAKILIMFLISSIQTISFILIGNYILEIKGMDLQYWFVLFTTSCFANILGLNISSAFTSVITIYILIPFILIPQLLFSGVIVSFDKLHKNNFSSVEYVPLIGNLMATRWSFEALAVEQFRNNKYERNFFRYDMGISQSEWYSNLLIPTLESDLEISRIHNGDPSYKEMVDNNIQKFNYYSEKLQKLTGFSHKIMLNTQNFDSVRVKEATDYLDSLKKQFRQFRKRYVILKDSMDSALLVKIGKENRIKLVDNYRNKRLENVVVQGSGVDQYIDADTKIIQKYEPAYMNPTSRFGMAQFYAPYKQVANIKIDTFWFDLIVLWVVTALFYIALYYNILQKFVTWIENLKLKDSVK
jgi:hypothetical protein